MGNCCGNQEEAEPLIRSGPVGARSGTLSEATQARVTQPGQSARQHNPVNHRDFETSIELITTVQLQSLPIGTIDKTFKDLSRLYNEVVDGFKALETDIHKFKEFFVEETAGIPVLATCVTVLVKRYGSARVTVERKSKNFIELVYDAREVSKSCSGNPEDVLQPLEFFKSACRHIRNILAHAPQVQSNATIILEKEGELRREIQKSDLSVAENQAATRSFLYNISKLRVMAGGTDTIYRDVEKKFKEFSRASEGFFVEE